MTQPLGVDDFFALEAGEYLDRLAGLAAGPTPPSAEELVRFTRALRGSALMANQQAIARATGSLEHVVRSYRDGRRTWDGELAALVREAIDVLRTLVERARTWTPEDGTRAERLALHLERSIGGAPRPSPGAATPRSDAGVRAFVAREAAALSSVLDQAARTMQAGAVSAETIQGVLRRMQPLRGLAALTDFPPLPDLLEGIERTVTGVGRLELPAPEGATRLDAATAGLSRAARDIAEHGRPDPDAVEFRQFADLLLAAPEETPIVAIESLFFEDGDGIIQEGAPPRSATATSFGAAAVVSRGEHLCQAADEIMAASSMAQRHLRLHVLGGDLRTLSAGLPLGLEIAIQAFAAAAQAAVVRGTAVDLSAEYADLIREAGSRLRGFTEVTQPATLAAMFEDLTAAMDRLGTEPAPAPAAAGSFEAAPVAPPPSATVGVEDDVVPIESLAPSDVTPVPDLPYIQVGEPLPAEGEEPEAEVVPIEWLAPDARDEAAVVEVASSGWDLAASYAQFEALLVSSDGGAIATPGPRPAVAPVAPELPLVEIADLLYHGRAALRRADELRRVIRSAISAEQPMSAIRPLVDELLDLVELAVAD